MKKILSGIMALMIAGTMSVSAFAAESVITAEEVKINDEAKNMPEALKESADDEEGMLRLSPATLLKIKLKLEGGGGNMFFLANKALEADEALGADTIQFIDDKTIADDGTVSIQFRPRLNQPAGVYNMRATAKNASTFSRFYKLVGDEIQPVLSDAADTPQKQDIAITVSGYTDAWKDVNALYEVTKGENETETTTLIPADAYSFEKDSGGTNLATLKIKTTGGWAAEGAHTLCFVPSDKAYNPITFTVNITEAVNIISSEFVSSTERDIPEELKNTAEITIPEGAKKNTNVEFSVTAPNGYDISSVAYKPSEGESVPLNADDDTYSFTMPDDDITVTVTVTPKTYTLNLDLQEGTYTGSTSITGSVEELIQLPAQEPSKEGFNFTNWRTEAGGNGSVVKNEHLNTISKLLEFFKDSNTRTIYACYVEQGKFKVAYLSPEEGVTDKPTDNNEYVKDETTEIPIPEQEPKRLGYTFLGWKVDGDGTLYKFGSDNDKYTNIDAIENKLEFVAQWDKTTYKITLHDETDTEISGNIDNLPLLPQEPVKAGYNFIGWFTAEENGEKIEAITAENADTLNNTTLYARWEEIQTDDYVIVGVNKENSSVNIIKRTEQNAWLIVATYTDNGNLVKATIKDISDVKTNATGTDVSVPDAFSGEYTKVKVFMWNSLDNMQPRCDAYPQ